MNRMSCRLLVVVVVVVASLSLSLSLSLNLRCVSRERLSARSQLLHHHADDEMSSDKLNTQLNGSTAS